MEVEDGQLIQRVDDVWMGRTEIDFFDGNELLIIWRRLGFFALGFEHSHEIVQGI